SCSNHSNTNLLDKLSIDSVNNNLCVWLTMTLLCMLMLLRLVLESNNFLSTTLFFNCSFNCSTFNKRSTDNCLIATNKNNFIKSYLVAFFCIKLFYVNCLTSFNFKLLATCFNNCVHLCAPPLKILRLAVM